MFVRKYFLIIKNLLKIANDPKSIKLKFIILIIMVEEAVKIIRLARKELFARICSIKTKYFSKLLW